MKAAIYCLKFGNGKIYVGRATDLAGRIAKHKNELKRNKHSNKHMQAVYNKYGLDSCETLEFTTKDKLAEKEIYWITKLGACNRAIGLNLEMPTGDHTCKVSEETKIKIGLAGKGRKRPDNIPRMTGNTIRCTGPHKLINLNTKEVVITNNLAEFARTHKLSPSTLWETIKHKNGRTQHKGWTQYADNP